MLSHADSSGVTQKSFSISVCAPALSNSVIVRAYPQDPSSCFIAKCDLTACGIPLADMVQLGETEKKIIMNLYENNEPIIGYLVHTQLRELEQTIITIEQKISHEHSLISIIPTQAKNPIYHYAFVFIFTAQQNPDEIKKLLPFPGIMTWIQKDQPLQTMTLT